MIYFVTMPLMLRVIYYFINDSSIISLLLCLLFNTFLFDVYILGYNSKDMISLYNSDKEIKIEVKDESYSYEAIMGEDSLTLYFSHPGYLEVPVGSWCDFYGKRYFLKKDSNFKKNGERNFEYYKAFDERLKKEYGYVFYPEAYAELVALCNDHFPSDKDFYEKAKDMNKTLIHLVDTDFPQSEFAYYIQRCPFSTKTYAGDFMQEVFDLFVRDIVTTTERKNLETKHPEFTHLMQEYRDGILLFNISNQKVWSKPAAEQPELEKAWLQELNKEYPVTINWKLLKKLKK